MKKSIIICLILIIQIALFAGDFEDAENWKKQNPFLGHYLSYEETQVQVDFRRDFYVTDPPAAPVRNIAEFEHMEGVLICYPFGISFNVIAEMSEDVMVTTIVLNQSQETYVTNMYNSNGVNLDNCNFLLAPSDSYWTRDYGPWYVVDGNNEVGIVNFPYNRPRPNDNDIPIEMANFLGIVLYGMDLIHAGGNYMTTGLGISASTELVWDENPSLSHEDVAQLVEDYLGIETYHVVPDPNNTYIDHIDCWGKFLDVDKVLIRSVAESHPQYDEIEAAAQYFSEQVSPYGNLFQVYRVYTPQNQPYTNSLILNKKVLVPITGSSWDDDALASYEDAMPGYEILGFTGSWQSTDALHCRAKGTADRGMLFVKHLPILGNAPFQEEYEILADVIPYSGEALYPDSMKVYYIVNGGDFISLDMSYEGGDTYKAIIPGQALGSEIAYYIHAADESGRSMDHPYIGAPDPHTFFIGMPIPPELIVNPDCFDMEMGINVIDTEIIELSNIGGGNIEYSIEIEDTTPEGRDITGSYVVCSEIEYLPGETITWIFTVGNASTDDEWLKDVYIEFPTSVTVNNATDFVGGSGGAMLYDGTTGNGVEINWHGETTSGWGVVHPGETAVADVNVTIDSSFTGDLVLNYQIDGDIYGSPPHSITGEIILTMMIEPPSWISANPVSGNLAGGETDEIEITFDTTDLEFGFYTCNIIIYDDIRNETIIPVSLTVIEVGSQEIMPEYTLLLNNYPNPFNPTTTINFSLNTENTESTEILIYNIKGQKIRQYSIFPEQSQAPYGAGKNQSSIIWNGKDDNNQPVGSGIYFYKLKVGDEIISAKKMILMK